MLERIVFRTDFPVEQKFLSEEISASRKAERKKVIFFLARRRVNRQLSKRTVFIFIVLDNHIQPLQPRKVSPKSKKEALCIINYKN